MKKWFLMLSAIFCFLSLAFNSSPIKAEDTSIKKEEIKSEIKVIDRDDNRKISIDLTGLPATVEGFYVRELKVCENQDDPDCKIYKEAGEKFTDIKMKPVNENPSRYLIDLSIFDGFSYTIPEYNIQTQSDGEIYIFIELFVTRRVDGVDKDVIYTPYNTFITYKLSTINQRVVVNPDNYGHPTHVYDNKQYTAARNNEISIKLLKDEYDVYSGKVYICEGIGETNTKCREYKIGESMPYYIYSYGDGTKTLNIYLVKKDQAVENDNFTDFNSTRIIKDINLDTIGPKISIEGGEWIFVPSGQKYKLQGATCKDSSFPNEECSVSNDLEVVNIKYNTDNYQFVTYSATDKLGNTTNQVVRVKVEVIKNDTDIMPILLASAFVLITTFTVLGVILYKNHQKKKKLSYI